MVNTGEETAGKKKATYWLEDSLRDDLKMMSSFLGETDTKILHEAVRFYKQSAEFKAAVEEYQRKQAEQVAAFTGASSTPAVPPKIKKTAHGLAKSASQKLHHKKVAG